MENSFEPFLKKAVVRYGLKLTNFSKTVFRLMWEMVYLKMSIIVFNLWEPLPLFSQIKCLMKPFILLSSNDYAMPGNANAFLGIIFVFSFMNFCAMIRGI